MPVGAESPFLGFDNRVDDGEIVAGSGDARIDALFDRALEEAWESEGDDPADTWLEVTLAEPTVTGLLSAHGLNASKYATWRWRGWADEEKTDLVHDSAEQELCPPIIPYDDREWGQDEFWSGKPPARHWSLRPRQVVHPLPARTRALVWRLDLADPGNADGLLRVGRLFVGDGIRPVYGMDLGAQLGMQTFERITRSPEGHMHVAESRPARLWQATFPMLSEGERQRVILLDTIAGATGEVVWAPHPDDPVKLQTESYLGILGKPRPIRRANNTAHPNQREFLITEWI